jgi:hypothetical protein
VMMQKLRFIRYLLPESAREGFPPPDPACKPFEAIWRERPVCAVTK